jgi:hypothetical protein
MAISKIDANSIDTSTVGVWTNSSNNISYTAGNVGIGGASLGGKFETTQGTSGSNFRHGSGTYLNISTGAANGTVDIKADAQSGSYPALTFHTGGAERIRIPSNAGGITFPATQVASANANTLDDYEEGTFTPTFSGSSSNPTITGSVFGSYVKIGRMVSVHIQWQMTYTGGSGVMSFALPFVVSTGYSHGHCGCIGPLYAASYPGSGSYPVYNCRADDGGTQLALWYSQQAGADGQWTFGNSSLGNFGSMSLVYDTTA